MEFLCDIPVPIFMQPSVSQIKTKMRWPQFLRPTPPPPGQTERERNRFARWRPQPQPPAKHPKLQNMVAALPPRKQVLQSATQPKPFRFTPERILFMNRKLVGGGRNEGLTLGTFDALDGTQPIRAIEKRIDLTRVKHADRYLPMAKAVYLNRADGLDPFLFDMGVHVRRIMRKCHSTTGCSHIATIVGSWFDDVRGVMYVYIRYYANGDLRKFMMKRRSRQEKCRALWGAWTGLQQLHLNLNTIHNDLSSGNIFINDDGEGVIADLEDTVVLPSSDAEGVRVCEAKYAFSGTQCYGAPFAHCDVRRDQVALLMTSLEVLSGVSWLYWCKQAIPKDADPSTYGYAATEDGRRITMGGTMYTMYATAIRAKLNRASAAGGDGVLGIVLNVLLEYAERLNDIAYQLSEDWDYKEVHQRIMDALSDGRNAP